jgi:hypothetical protein
MERAAAFVVRWRLTIIALTLAVALSALWMSGAR